MSNTDENSTEYLISSKFYVNPTESVTQTNKIIRNVKKEQEDNLKKVRSEAEFDFPNGSEELYDAIVFRNSLYPTIKMELKKVNEQKRMANKTNIYRAETQPNFSPNRKIEKETKTSNGNFGKNRLMYTLNEYYHPGKYKQFTIGDKPVSILVWSCCINKEEKARVIFIFFNHRAVR